MTTNQKKGISFQKALILPLGIILTTLVLVVSIFGYYQRANRMEQMFKEDKMPLMVQGLVEKVTANFDKPQFVGQTLSANDNLLYLLQHPEEDIEQIKRIIHRTQVGLDLIYLNFYCLATNQVLNEDGFYKEADRDNARDAWIFSTLEHQNDFTLNISYLKHLGQYACFINQKIKDPDSGEIIALVGLAVGIPLVEQMIKEEQMGASGSNFLLGHDGALKIYDHEKMVGGNIFEQEEYQALSDFIGSGQEGLLESEYEGENHWFYVKKLPGYDWLVVAQVHEDEVMAELKEELFTIVFLCIMGLLVIFGTLSYFIRRINLSFQQLITYVENVKGGQEDVELLMESRIEEIVLLAESFQQFVHSTTAATRFADRIAQGDLSDSDEESLNGDDRLGGALLAMKNALASNKKQETTRQWINQGMAQFADLLRDQNLEVSALTDRVLSRIIKYLGLNQGALFVLREKAGEEVLKLSACYAYDRKKYMDMEVYPGKDWLGNVLWRQPPFF
ncbi:Cache 3/Cache 2 fusion domain-containing protein [Persicobacter sp. CCB-QB2]|uniref:PDC sensor domain-containing protein n=1 Tax=Persicobacter sp. CCB-QB2 TaxID=1561025 RepID=UPI0006A9C1B0|nr:Cache 3/Cache 2 fusion domain-containing protein [Persicobacter sp. CCB-QB2]